MIRIKQKQVLLFLLTLLIAVCIACQRPAKRSFVVSRIRSASKLATTEFVLTKLIMARQDKKLLFLVNLNTATFLAHTEATVKTGIDLSKLREKNVIITGDRINLILPPVEIINFSYPAEKFEIDPDYTTERVFLNHMSIETIDELYRQGELEIRKSLSYLGVAEATENKTRLLVESLLKTMGYKEVYIDFEKSDQLFPKEEFVE